MPAGWAAGAAVVGSMISGSASRSAASQQADAAQRAREQDAAAMEAQAARQEPFRIAGVESADRLRKMLGDGGELTKRFSAVDLNADPVYQSGLEFGQKQGTDAINARALGMGQYDSGATLKALTKFGNDYGSTKANESYNRFNTDMTNLYNRNAGVMGAGQTATNQVNAASNATAARANDSIIGAGNARAAGVLGEGNAWTSALNSMSKNYMYGNKNGGGNDFPWQKKGGGNPAGYYDSSAQDF